MPKLTDLLGRPHSGIVPHAVVGIVVDNDDPQDLGRVQVKFPTLFEEPVSYWLRVAAPDAGKGTANGPRGLYSIPEVEDEVLVLFMQGSQDVGIIAGQFWNGVDKPPDEILKGPPGAAKTEIPAAQISTAKFNDGETDATTNNDRRIWKSRSGHLLVFDDTDGKETVQIWDQTHTLAFVFDSKDSAIFLTNSKGDIHIRTKTDLYLEAGQNILWYAGKNLEGEAKMDIIEKAGMNYEFEAGMDAKMKAGMNFKTEAGMNHENKAGMMFKAEGSIGFEAKGGATAKLEGGAMTTVKGGMVMIN